MDSNKVVIFTGAGISAESGIDTFRGDDGLWTKSDPEKIASVDAWVNTPEDVLAFHNQRLIAIAKAQPNEAHLALKRLEDHFEVIVVTGIPPINWTRIDQFQMG